MSATLTVSLEDLETAFLRWVSDQSMTAEEYEEYLENTSVDEQAQDALRTFLSYLKD